MVWIDLVAVLAVLQLLGFGLLVASARGKYGVHAPAVTGHPQFERLYRVQMNTLELLVALLPGLYIAAHYWAPGWVALCGAVYLLGRMVYWRAYTQDPARRALGFGLSIFPILALLGASLVGMLLQVISG